ncbi:MAG: FAD-dependent monooxygenase [Bacteroidota bacterium]|nr:MAG: FAD-dependent monooxygenase [Bacteroidota bacterium]
MESTDKPIEVLIAGAGPTGLMMACQLAIHQIPFRIIDKKSHPSTYSGALIIHARTMEIFDQMGIAEKALQETILANDLSVVFNGVKKAHVSLRDIGQGLSKFPNLHLIEQSKTEQLLIDFILSKGRTIEWKTELKSFSKGEVPIASVVQKEGEKEEIIKSNYLVAADGGNSFVREQLKIPFIGKRHPISLFIIDCKAETDLPADEMCFSFSNYSTSGFFPLKEGRKRIDGIIPKNLEGKDRITFEDVEVKFAERLRTKIRLYNPEWFSVSHSHQRYAKVYQKTNIFLAGDAAHTFTPVGAQGMNTGIQDAYNLAWKLSFVIKQKAHPALLQSYATERIGIAKRTAHFTGLFYSLVTSPNVLIKTIRLQALPFILNRIFVQVEKRKKLSNSFFKALSGTGINYRKNTLKKPSSFGSFPRHSPKPGDRFPYLVYTDKENVINIQDRIDRINFTLFVFTDERNSFNIDAIAQKYHSILNIEELYLSGEKKHLFDQFGIKKSGFYLVRPDMYVAYRSSAFDYNHLERYLYHYLKR